MLTDPRTLLERFNTHLAANLSRSFPERVLAYLDILGWTELTHSGADLRIFSALAFLNMGSLKIGSPASDKVRSSSFSDSIVYSSDPTPESVAQLVFQVQTTCLCLLFQGHYVRGGITIGPLAHAEGMIGGRALIEGYNLERKVAIYPRIVVADRVAPLLTLPLRQSTLPLGPLQTHVDTDGLRYLELFPLETDGGRLPQVREIAAAIRDQVRADHAATFKPEKYSNHCIALNRRAKYAWMLQYLDRVVGSPNETPNDSP